VTRPYKIAPGVTRLRAIEAQQRRPAKRVSHWLTATLAKPRKGKAAVEAQQSLF
jgi:hypothetical protein